MAVFIFFLTDLYRIRIPGTSILHPHRAAHLTKDVTLYPDSCTPSSITAVPFTGLEDPIEKIRVFRFGIIVGKKTSKIIFLIELFLD